MTESFVSILGSLASIIGLIFVFTNKSSTQTIKALLIIVAIMSCSTSYLISKNSKYESAQYQEIANSFRSNLNRREASREAKKLLSSFPSYISNLKPGDNEGVIYSTLRLLEANKSQFPELYARFKENILSDIDSAKGARSSPEFHRVLEDGALASIRIVKGIAGDYEN